MQHNQYYIDRINAWGTFPGRENIACQQMLKVKDIFDFDSINTVLDIGSWHLKQSIEFAWVFPTANVYAFEPSPQNLEECLHWKSTVDEEMQSRIHLNTIALSDKNGPITFYDIDKEKSIGIPNAGAASKYKLIEGRDGTFFNQKWAQKEITVDAMTMDHWAMTNGIKSVDAIWIDVQGGELDVFKGGSQTLKNVKIIFTEVGLEAYYEGQSLKPQIEEFLFKYGFEEVSGVFELNGFAYEGNTIYIKK
jgi:FkbM family methyltransferase